MSSDLPDHTEVHALAVRAEAEDAAYAERLAALDRLASFALPAESLPELPAQLERINQLCTLPDRPPGGGLSAEFRKRVWDALAPVLGRQEEWNANLVRILNGTVAEYARLHVHYREVVSHLVRFLQSVLPAVDARDRVASALATTRAELILEAFDRRQESLSRRVDSLQALRDRLEVLGEELSALRAALAAAPPPPSVASAAVSAVDDADYVAFENRYRGSSEQVRERLSGYVDLFREQAPVLDLGCGRGEFLALLAAGGVAARGVESNAHVARQCQARGLDVAHGDLIAFLRAQADASAGGVFAAQVAEHLPPRVLQEMLREAHRVVRPGGLLALETVNPRSVVGFLEVYNRDLTHERPLHPDTLSFLAAAAGFLDVRVEYRTPVEPLAQLQAVPSDGLPERAAVALNENVARLNGLLFGPQEYALFARR